MESTAALDRLKELLDASDDTTVNTSMRLPANLRDAAVLVVEEFGEAPSMTTMTASALRQTLETVLMEQALRLHYEQHPEVKPTLAEVARALAAMDGSPLAGQPDVLERAAEEVTARRPSADADDVLLWAEAQLALS